MSEQAAPAPKRSFKEQVSHLWQEGMVQHVVITAKSGRRVIDVPLVVVIGVGIVAPWVAAIGAVIAVVRGGKIGTERQEEPAAPPAPAEEPSAAEAGGEQAFV
ncbi:MAG: DUF4342 domain-containing protein [Chloroflexi bacterium]|nr:DUF4342 domain-containing protein [Chloroflexota bacterium]